MSRVPNRNRGPSRPFEAHLKADAHRTRPPFSEALHERTMRALQCPDLQCRDRESPPPAAARRTRRTGLVFAIAASVLLMAAGAWQYRLHRAETVQVAHEPAAALANSGAIAFADRNSPTAPANYSLDDLNRGASLAMRLVVDRLPLEIPGRRLGTPQRRVIRWAVISSAVIHPRAALGRYIRNCYLQPAVCRGR